jgi:hypothetical protein
VNTITLPAIAERIITMLIDTFLVSKKNSRSIAPAMIVVIADFNSSSLPNPSKISAFGLRPDGM